MRSSRSLLESPVRPPAPAVVSDALPGSGFGAVRGPGAAELEEAGFVEEERLVSVEASVYDEREGEVVGIDGGIPATTRILVRRPDDPARASGLVVIEPLDAPRGYDCTEVWSAIRGEVLDAGHTWVGMTAAPVAADALHNADAERYARVSWRRDPAVAPQTLVVTGPEDDTDVVLDGAEEGLVWDLLTGLARALRDGAVPDVRAEAVLAVGHSSAGVQLNTFANTLHGPYSEALGAPVLDGYLNVGGGGIRRTLRQDSTQAGIASWRPARPPRLTVPHVTVSSEADHVLFGSALLARRVDLGPLVRHVQVPGAPHRDVTDPSRPAPEQIARAGRCVYCRDVHSSVIPLGPVVEGMFVALVRWVREGVPAPESRWLTLGETGSLLRDELGNVTGGVRTGLADMPVATMLGASAEHLLGDTRPMSRACFEERYGSRAEYFMWFDIIENVSREERYVTARGAARHREIAAELIDRIGVR